MKDGAGGCQEPGTQAQGWGRNSVRGGEGQRMKWHSWQGAHKGLALTPSLAVPQPRGLRAEKTLSSQSGHQIL